MDRTDFQLMLEKAKKDYHVEFEQDGQCPFQPGETLIKIPAGLDHILVVHFDGNGCLLKFDFELVTETECEACGKMA